MKFKFEAEIQYGKNRLWAQLINYRLQQQNQGRQNPDYRSLTIGNFSTVDRYLLRLLPVTCDLSPVIFCNLPVIWYLLFAVLEDSCFVCDLLPLIFCLKCIQARFLARSPWFRFSQVKCLSQDNLPGSTCPAQLHLHVTRKLSLVIYRMDLLLFLGYLSFQPCQNHVWDH